MAHRFVGLGKKIMLHRFDPTDQGFKKVRQVLWGDWLTLEDNPPINVPDDWLAVRWAPNSDKAETLYIPEKDTTEHRPLEIIFLDVGQGDGAILITPELGEEERIMVIDAGESDNMCRFLNGRFKAYRGFQFDAAVITHPDQDHYLGFQAVFDDLKIGFNKIYQNGLVERAVSGKFEKIGKVEEDTDKGEEYMTELAKSREDIEALFSDEDFIKRRRFKFPKVMLSALKNDNIKEFEMLFREIDESADQQAKTFMPDFAPSDNRGYTIEVLGPIAERDADENLRLRKISSDYGETKNGHSILLRLEFGDFKVLFGGDLNTKAERFLLQQYTGRQEWPDEDSDESKAMIDKARDFFQSEIMKVCHHGASDVTDEFMQAVNPACFVISSGDMEGHVHPRPDLLGRLGNFGRGESPVLLSTELQRSTRPSEDKKLVEDLNKNIEKLSEATEEEEKEELIDEIKGQIRELSRSNVAVYGAIYVKTDGKRLITAFKFEEPSDKKKWFYFEYKLDAGGKLVRT